MTRHIGGTLNLEAMRVLYRPTDPSKLGAEVRRLSREGLRPRDLATALRMPLSDVLAALRQPRDES